MWAAAHLPTEGSAVTTPEGVHLGPVVQTGPLKGVAMILRLSTSKVSWNKFYTVSSGCYIFTKSSHNFRAQPSDPSAILCVLQPHRGSAWGSVVTAEHRRRERGHQGRGTLPGNGPKYSAPSLTCFSVEQLGVFERWVS